MTYTRDAGFVEGEDPRRLHRLDAMTGGRLSLCQKPIIVLPANDYSWATCEVCYPAPRLPA